MKVLGVSGEEQKALWLILGAIYHLGAAGATKGRDAHRRGGRGGWQRCHGAEASQGEGEVPTSAHCQLFGQTREGTLLLVLIGEKIRDFFSGAACPRPASRWQALLSVNSGLSFHQIHPDNPHFFFSRIKAVHFSFRDKLWVKRLNAG